MKKNLLTALCTLCLCLLLAPAALAKEGETIERTDISTDSFLNHESYALEKDISYTLGDSDSEGLIKLGKPTELTWGQRRHELVDGQIITDEIPGFVSWKTATPDQGEAKVTVYRVGEDKPVYRVTWSLGAADRSVYWSVEIIRADLDSGTYYFTMQSLGDGIRYEDSDVAISGQWTYTKPKDQMPALSVKGWDWPLAQWEPIGDDECCFGYEVQYYVSTALGERGKKISTSILENAHRGEFKISDNAIQRGGEGYYTFRVRALSADITKYCKGPWSDFSEPYYLSADSAAIQQQLTDIAEEYGKGDDAAIREAVQDLDRDTLRTAMLADSHGSGVISAMEGLESKLSAGLTVESHISAIEGYKVDVVGALLNPLTDKEVTLYIDQPQERHVIPERYDSALAVQFQMELEGVAGTDDLAVPVAVTLPIPETIDPAFLVLLHYAADGSAETIGKDRYNVYQGKDQWYVYFILDHFSDFVLTQEKQESTHIPGDVTGDGKVNALDLLRLKRFLAGEDVEIGGSADITGDGKVNALDLLRLKRYLSGEEVEVH